MELEKTDQIWTNVRSQDWENRVIKAQLQESHKQEIVEMRNVTMQQGVKFKKLNEAINGVITSWTKSEEWEEK
jgi:hypothetical protein